ncbi:ATP-binding protein [Oscillochloris sp. ZM17-4]|uniref:ATP-binding protein n=1 Tax=Oscillochloris sp. ZM17-4 TaxID=2866714 RepID=UPI001C733722|nr:ATP-binding protein [Oscillochloris sp. ZM17-4]MBX0329815.1 ATP-binding protein [Oscillochloris sp. ZM17-4]
MLFPISSDQIYALAASDLPSYRQLRYDGDGIDLDIDSLTPSDRQIVELLYRRLGDLLEILRGHRESPEGTFERLKAYGDSIDWDGLIKLVRGLGSDDNDDPTRAKVFHDLRGGGFMALAIYLQMIGLGMVRAEDTHRMFNLARDQLKIMRNSVRGIDPEGFARDRGHQLHHIGLLLEKWGGGEGHQLQGARAEVLVDSHFQGAVSERCLEFSALDRVIYNLINNATAHSADGKVYMSILPLGEGAENLRFAVFNRASAQQQAKIEGRFPGGPGLLFQGGFTTGGSGLGMRICADFVCNAYGLPAVEQALAEGHLGARFIDGYFVAWFHWPVAAE